MKPVPFYAEMTVVKKYEDAKGAFHIVGYAATDDFDLQGDIISREAMKESEQDLMGNSTVLFNHDDDSPIGKIVSQSLDEKGLLIDALIDGAAIIPKTGAKVVDLIKQGILNKFSIRAKVLDAVKEFVDDLGRVANVIKRMLLVECSLVSVPANPEAKALNWYIKKALDEGSNMKTDEEKKEEVKKDEELKAAEELKKSADSEKDEKKDEEKKDEEKKEESNEDKEIEKSEGEKSEDEKKEEDEKSDEEGGEESGEEEQSEISKSFPTTDELEKSWGEYCIEKDLSFETSEDDLVGAWNEFCKGAGFPEGFYYTPKSATAVKQVVFLLDKLIGGSEGEMTSSIAKQIKSMITNIAGDAKPYPGAYSEPLSKNVESDEEKDASDNMSVKNAEVIERMMKEIASIKKSYEEKKEEKKTVRKGLVEEKEEEVKKSFEVETEGKEPHELEAQLRILVGQSVENG